MRALVVVAAVVALAAAAAPRGDAARTGLPSSWTVAGLGPDGGVVYQGRIPNLLVPTDRRLSAVYLPPGYNAARRYRVVYLLHGMAGRPTSIWNGLHLAEVADGLIASGQTKPFVAVMPVAGPTVDPGAGESSATARSSMRAPPPDGRPGPLLGSDPALGAPLRGRRS